VAVAQLVRALDCGSKGRGFKSPQPPLKTLINSGFFRFLAGTKNARATLVLQQGRMRAMGGMSTRRQIGAAANPMSACWC
jgi:hypothetical protein